MTGRCTLTIIAAILFIQSSPLLAEERAQGVGLWSACFYEQIKASSDAYLSARAFDYLQQLDTLNREMQARDQLPLGERLDFGEMQEPSVVGTLKQVDNTAGNKGLIDFQEEHNGRLDQWGAGEIDRVTFLDPLRMKKDLTREIKQERFPDPWPYVAVHWYPRAVSLGKENHEIPKDALELVPERWRPSDGQAPDETLLMYAFFSFLRKACHPESFDKAFLGRESGDTSFWSVAETRVPLKRWRKEDYYVYLYIPPETQPKRDSGSLKGFVRAQCLWSKGSEDLARYYERKLRLFAELVDEMARQDSIQAGLEPYMSLYSFVCRSFPCISAFKMESSHGLAHFAPGYRFVEGYPEDHPASGVFDNTSPMGKAWHLHRLICMAATDEASKVRWGERLFFPILLLQFHLPDPPEEGSLEFPYQDLKVGYKGYLDFCRKFSGSKEAKP